MCPSLEDKRALEILNQTIKRVDDHYSVGLPWKEEEPKLPNNRKMALERLNGLKKRFQNDSEVFRQYCEKMDEYL